jgi:hypothetical protein
VQGDYAGGGAILVGSGSGSGGTITLSDCSFNGNTAVRNQ